MSDPDDAVQEAAAGGTAMIDVSDPLVVRAAISGLYSRLLGGDPRVLAEATELFELAMVLDAAGELEALGHLGPLLDSSPLDRDMVAARHVRLFDHAQAPPYQTTYMATGIAGNTGQLADIAGFYRAFGFGVSGDRPDHVAVELEFLALASLAEAKAVHSGEPANAEIARSATSRFMEEHLGCWLSRFADKIDAEDPGGPFGPLARSVAAWVSGECARLGIEPLEPSPPMYLDDTDPSLECGDLPGSENFPGMGVPQPVGDVPVMVTTRIKSEE